jgi:ABC-type sugar transport system permease subunit
MTNVALDKAQALFARAWRVGSAEGQPQLAQHLVHAASGGIPDPVPGLSARSRRLDLVHRRPHRRGGEFVGLENYEWLWDDSVFWLSVFNTLLYTIVASIIKFAVGLYLAILLNENLPFKAMLRAVVLIPFIVPTVLSAIAFWWLYDSQFSIISWSLRKTGLIATNIDFLGDVWNARWSVIFANIWRGVPFVAITLLAGLQTVSPSLYEAATIDGANRWQMFRHVTYPLLTPIIAGGDDVLGAVHLHGFPVDLGADTRRAGQRHATDGDTVLSARHLGGHLGEAPRSRPP